MITIEEKLNLFSKQIFERIQSSSKEKIKKIEKDNKVIIKEHREKIKEEKYRYVENRILKERNKNQKIIAKKKGQINKDIIIKKNELFQKILESIKVELRDFTTKEEYKNYFIKYLEMALKEVFNKNNIEIQITNKDSKRFKEKIEIILLDKGWEKENISITSINEDIIGGLILIDKDDNIIVDISLLTKIEESQDYIGEILYEALEKRGEIDEG